MFNLLINKTLPKKNWKILVANVQIISDYKKNFHTEDFFKFKMPNKFKSVFELFMLSELTKYASQCIDSWATCLLLQKEMYIDFGVKSADADINQEFDTMALNKIDSNEEDDIMMMAMKIIILQQLLGRF